MNDRHDQKAAFGNSGFLGGGFVHRQQRPSYILRQSLRFVDEAVGTLARRSQGDDAKGIWYAYAFI